MASSKRWSRLRLGALAVLLLLIVTLAYFVSKAAALNEDTIRADIVARLASWSGGAVEVSGPIELHYFPDFAVTMGTMRIAKAPHLPQVESVSATAIRVELGLRSLVLPEAILHRITLTDLDVALRSRPRAITPSASSEIQFDARPLIEALRTMPVPEIVIVNGAISRNEQNGRDAFNDVNVFAGVSAAGNLRASGNMAWRDEKLEFSLETRLPAEDDPAANGPLTLALNAGMVKAEVEGKVMLADGLRATGSMSLQIPHLRRFTRWAGLSTSDGLGLNTFEAAGGFRLTQQRLSFDEGTFALDGNRALGALALDFGTARPLVSGTLAFSSFELSPYLSKPASTARVGATDKPAAEQKAGETSLLHHLDLDLRLSTSTVQAAKFTLGQAAVSATVKAGRLMADFAILDFCNGSGSGRVAFDAAQPEPAIKLNGNFNRISAQECLQLAFGQAPVTADLDIFVDATSRGRTVHDVLSSLDGRLDLESGPGSIALDLAALAKPASETAPEGWPALMKGSTAFSDLRVALVFKRGSISAESIKMRTTPYIYTGRGRIDPAEGAIDISIAARTPSPEGTTGEPRTPAEQRSFRLGGSLSNPKVTLPAKMDASGDAASPGPAPPATAPVR